MAARGMFICTLVIAACALSCTAVYVDSGYGYPGGYYPPQDMGYGMGGEGMYARQAPYYPPAAPVYAPTTEASTKAPEKKEPEPEPESNMDDLMSLFESIGSAKLDEISSLLTLLQSLIPDDGSSSDPADPLGPLLGLLGGA